jgi:hypothetical protein
MGRRVRWPRVVFENQPISYSSFPCDDRIMPTRSSKDHDFTRSGLRTVEQVIGEKWDGSPLEKPTKNPAAVALGKLGGARAARRGRRHSVRVSDLL